MGKAIRSLSKEESKKSFKGKTITLKENDDSEKREKIYSLKKENKIKLLYCSIVNDITQWVYEYTK